MRSDPLSDVLSLLKPDTHVAGGYDLGGDWSVQFEVDTGVKYFAVVSGTAWIEIEGGSGAMRLDEGDCVLLPHGRRFVISKDRAVQPLPFDEIPESDWNGGIARVNGGGDAMILGGHFAFADSHTDLLLGTMPPITRLRDESDRLGLRWALDRMRRELAGHEPGSVLVVQQLALLLLVQALRLFLNHGQKQGVGWLFALGDPRIAAAIGAMHAHPGTRWTLPVLAEKAGMSRSKFALRFKAVAGSSPIEYLTRWRMLLASDRLARGDETIASISSSLGYESEAAFGTAFKRVMGSSPRKHAAGTGNVTG